MDGVAPSLVGADGAAVSHPHPAPPVADHARPRPGDLDGIRFYKMSGSGNDFVFFDARGGAPPLAQAGDIAALCARGVGVGADGVVFMDHPAAGVVRIAYYNSDGSRAALCGNATLCTAQLAVYLGAAPVDTPFLIQTDAGELRAWVSAGEGPSFELRPVESLVADTGDARVAGAGWREHRIGYAHTGVPHVVVEVDDVPAVDLVARGERLRQPTAERPEGANVNFVGRGSDGQWLMRTYERGVEAETLACGTGAVACAAVLRAWSAAGDRLELVTRSGRTLRVTLTEAGPAVLSGEGRLVYEGVLRGWRA